VPSHSARRALFWRLRPTLADRLENDGLMRQSPLFGRNGQLLRWIVGEDLMSLNLRAAIEAT